MLYSTRISIWRHSWYGRRKVLDGFFFHLAEQGTGGVVSWKRYHVHCLYSYRWDGRAGYHRIPFNEPIDIERYAGQYLLYLQLNQLSRFTAFDMHIPEFWCESLPWIRIYHKLSLGGLTYRPAARDKLVQQRSLSCQRGRQLKVACFRRLITKHLVRS